MESSIESKRVTDLLETLYADAATNDPLVREAIRASGVVHTNEADHYHAMRNAYMPVSRDFGRLLYTLARGTQARTVVEFGTSFGVSTTYLAAAMKDNGAGRVIGTEFEPEKAERARQNLAAAGLADWVDIRVGDAMETLRTGPGDIDLVLLDGAKSMYYDVLRLLEPRLRPGAVVASDNTDHAELADFLTYLRTPANGYTSSAITTSGRRSAGQEISLRH